MSDALVVAVSIPLARAVYSRRETLLQFSASVFRLYVGIRAASKAARRAFTSVDRGRSHPIASKGAPGRTNLIRGDSPRDDTPTPMYGWRETYVH
jgi:hypothetical protein